MLLSLFLAASLAPGVNINPDGLPPGAIVSGTLRGADGTESPAALRINCFAPQKSLALELIGLPHAPHDFDYADFSGAEPRAGDKPLSRLSWTTGERVTSVSSAAHVYGSSGNYRFYILQDGPRGAAASLLRAIGDGAGTLAWVQTSLDEPRRTLQASFALGPAAARGVRDLVAPCLSEAPTAQP